MFIIAYRTIVKMYLTIEIVRQSSAVMRGIDFIKIKYKIGIYKGQKREK